MTNISLPTEIIDQIITYCDIMMILQLRRANSWYCAVVRNNINFFFRKKGFQFGNVSVSGKITPLYLYCAIRKQMAAIIGEYIYIPSYSHSNITNKFRIWERVKKNCRNSVSGHLFLYEYTEIMYLITSLFGKKKFIITYRCAWTRRAGYYILAERSHCIDKHERLRLPKMMLANKTNICRSYIQSIDDNINSQKNLVFMDTELNRRYFASLGS